MRAAPRAVAQGGVQGFSCVVNYNDPNLTTEYQSFMTYLEGPRDVGRICGKLSSVTIATIIGTIQGVGQGAPAYSVACGDLNDVGARPTWSWFAHNLEYGLRPNMGGQGSRKDAASMALTARCTDAWDLHLARRET